MKKGKTDVAAVSAAKADESDEKTKSDKEPSKIMKRTDRKSDFVEEKKHLRLMRKLPDETKKLISDAIKSDSTPISEKDSKKKKGKGTCADVVKLLL